MSPKLSSSSTRKRRRKPSSDDSDSDSNFTEPARSTKRRRRRPRDEIKSELALPAPPHPASLHVIKNAAPIRTELLRWYARVHEARGMPWRKAYDPTAGPDGRAQRAYEVWISEIMLQQTQVATVIPYYNRWIAQFPTITDLAASDIEAVNGLWKGLGYYSRAARLLAGAKKVVADFGGRLPDTATGLIAHVPGVGRYSAGAICSIAYNQREPVLDGNVTRLLSRVLALHAGAKAKATLDVLWAGATAMVDGAESPGDVNQALIELGSTVCKVRDPACARCPLTAHCAAYRESKGTLPEEQDIEELCTVCEPPLPDAAAGVTRYPMKAERKKAREETDVVSVVEWSDPASAQRWFLLVRRPEKGLLAGLHEFPTTPNVGAPAPTALQDIAHEQLAGLLLAPPPARTGAVARGALHVAHVRGAGDVVHVFSHIRKTYRVQWVALRGGGGAPPALSTVHGSTDAPADERRRVKRAGAVDARTRVEPGVRWVLLEDVADANIGTGVLKVWNKARALWEE